MSKIRTQSDSGPYFLAFWVGTGAGTDFVLSGIGVEAGTFAGLKNGVGLTAPRLALGGESTGAVVEALKPLETCGLNFSAWERALRAGSAKPSPEIAFCGEVWDGGAGGGSSADPVGAAGLGRVAWERVGVAGGAGDLAEGARDLVGEGGAATTGAVVGVVVVVGPL